MAFVFAVFRSVRFSPNPAWWKAGTSRLNRLHLKRTLDDGNTRFGDFYESQTFGEEMPGNVKREKKKQLGLQNFRRKFLRKEGETRFRNAGDPVPKPAILVEGRLRLKNPEKENEAEGRYEHG